MRKIIALITSVFLIITLSACDFGTTVQTHVVEFKIDDKTTTKIIVSHNKTIPLSSYPAITHFDLENWYLDSAFKFVFDPTRVITNDVTLYAKPIVTITNIYLDNKKLNFESNHDLFNVYIDNVFVMKINEKQIDLSFYLTKKEVLIRIDAITKEQIVLISMSQTLITTINTHIKDVSLQENILVINSDHDVFNIYLDDVFKGTTSNNTFDISNFLNNKNIVVTVKPVLSDGTEKSEKKYLLEYNSEDNQYIIKSYDNIEYMAYYEGIQGLYGEELFLALRDIISVMNKVSYGDVRYVLENSDRDPEDNFNSVRGMYNQSKIATYWIGSGAGAWQREHVWPNSKLGIARVNNNTKNQGSDLHNLRAIDGINQTRDNYYFEDNPQGGSGAIYTKGESFYPGDVDKGDVARILVYMVVRYEFLNVTSQKNLLRMSNNYVVESAYAGSLEPLLKWHEEDPVDAFEIRRNEFIYSGKVSGRNITPQGNRNPFIDYPNLFESIYYYLVDKDEKQLLTMYHLEVKLFIIEEKRKYDF